MALDKIIPFAHHLLEKSVSTGDAVVDATVGNGHDTVFLARQVGANGRVFGFDIQKAAFQATERRLQENGLRDRVTLFHCGHEHLQSVIPDACSGKITGAIFNLGYLPGGDHHIVTTARTTRSAIEQLLDLLAPRGVIVLVVYHGHPEGQLERDAVLEYSKQLDQKKAQVLEYRFLNQVHHAPFLLAIEKMAQWEKA